MRLRPAGILLGLLLAGQGWLLLPGDTRAAEFTMETAARYDVLPGQGRIDVSVEVAFTNTTPDPAGQFSLFEEVKLAIHDQAVEVTAHDDAGELAVNVAVDERGVNVATVELRDGVRFEESAAFTLGYRLTDSEDRRLRVRPSLVVFPAWGFGTGSEVSVVLPPGYDVTVDGDPLTAEIGAAQTVLRSGSIADPTHWVSLVTAAGPAGFTTLSATVPLAGGTADLRVRAFADDRAWGERILSLLERALPLLEQHIGLPYSWRGPLVVTEAPLPRDAGPEVTGADGEILVAFDEPDFTALHQAVHLWLSPDLVQDRWIAEGLASHFAGQVAAEIGVALPYDPAEMTSQLAGAAFPLAAWPAAPAPDQDRYGYAASWVACDALAASAGGGVLQAVLKRVVAGSGPYDTPRDEQPSGTAPQPQPLTSRSLLDHLEGTVGVPLAELFAATVLTADDAGLLDQRAAARNAHGVLLTAAGDWGTPEPVRSALSAWQFAEASQAIADAVIWLAGRDQLLADIADAGLLPSDRLRDSYREHGGGAEAQSEREAEERVVDAYVAAREEARADRSLIEEVGLVGGPDVEQRLQTAARRFAEGDLRGATEALGEARGILSAAVASGTARVLSAALVGLVAIALGLLLARRQRRGTEMRR